MKRFPGALNEGVVKGSTDTCDIQMCQPLQSNLTYKIFNPLKTEDDTFLLSKMNQL